MYGIRAFKDDRAVRAGHGCGIVGAVVRANIDIHKPGRIVLRADALKQRADDRAFVARRDKNCKAMVLRRAGFSAPVQQRNGNIEKLIGIADKKQRHDNGVDGFNSTHGSSPPAAGRPSSSLTLLGTNQAYRRFLTFLL